MVCRLCLNKGDFSILIFNDANIQKNITKFLQLELTPEDPVSNVICTKCWEQLDGFEKFCLQIEEAQKTLKTLEEGLVKEEANSIFVKDLSPLKQEEQAEESIGSDGYNNLDLLDCLDASLLKVEMPVDDQINIPQSLPSNTSESIPLRRNKGNRNTTTFSLETKQEDNDDVDEDDKEEDDDTEEYVASDTDEYEEEPKPKRKRKYPPSKSKLMNKEHDEIIKNFMKLTCEICFIDLADFDSLQVHFKAVHKCNGYAVCCNKKLKNRALIVDHINTHKNPDYFKCQECGKVMSDKSCMQRHMLNVHPTDDEKKYQCPDCPCKFTSRYKLDYHTVIHLTEDKCPYVCKECGERFPKISMLNTHMKRKHSTYYRMCEFCAKLFRHKTTFERHMVLHSDIVRPQVQCEECGSWLKDRSSLQKHMNNKHDHQEHICNVCGHHSPSKSALQSHIKYVHETEASLKCTFCEKLFKSPIKLKEHVATHTGEMLYTCPHCPAMFNATSNLHSHRKRAHREEWEKNRRCAKKEPAKKVV